MGWLGCRDEREQRISDVEYISQAVRAKAEECLAAVDDGQSPHCLLHCTQRAEWQVSQQPKGIEGGEGGGGGAKSVVQCRADQRGGCTWLILPGFACEKLTVGCGTDDF